jgi:hypothetical protein
LKIRDTILWSCTTHGQQWHASDTTQINNTEQTTTEKATDHVRADTKKNVEEVHMDASGMLMGREK